MSDRETSAESALAAAVALLGSGQATSLAAGAADAFDAVVQAIHPRLARRSDASERGEGAAFLIVESEAAALERGARVCAIVDGPWALAPGEAAELLPPRVSERAEVVTAALAREHEELLDASPWGRCTRRSVLPASGHHEAAGGFALAAAASLVTSGRADEVLAVGGRSSVLWVTRFSAPALRSTMNSERLTRTGR